MSTSVLSVTFNIYEKNKNVIDYTRRYDTYFKVS